MDITLEIERVPYLRRKDTVRRSCIAHSHQYQTQIPTIFSKRIQGNISNHKQKYKVTLECDVIAISCTIKYSECSYLFLLRFENNNCCSLVYFFMNNLFKTIPMWSFNELFKFNSKQLSYYNVINSLDSTSYCTWTTDFIRRKVSLSY